MNLLRNSDIIGQGRYLSAGRLAPEIRRTSHDPWLLRMSLLLIAVWLIGFTACTRDSSNLAAVQTADSRCTGVASEVAIAPDASQLAWTSGSAICAQDLSDESSKPWPIAEGTDIVWSPDSSQLAFLSGNAYDRLRGLYVVGVGRGAPKQLAKDLSGSMLTPQWSPDGKTLAFLFVDDPPRVPDPALYVPPPVGVIGENAFVTRLAVVDLPSGHARLVSPPDLYIYEYDWSLDGKEFVATAGHGNGDNNWYIAQLYTISVDSGEAKSILTPHMQITKPRWSPDGIHIAFVGGMMSGRSGGNVGDIYLTTSEGGRAEDITPQMKASARQIIWLSPTGIFMNQQVEGQAGLAVIDLTQHRIEPLWIGAKFSPEGGWCGNVSLAKDGKTSALVLQSPDRPPDIWAGPVGAWKQLTHTDQTVHRTWGKKESLHWKSDNWDIQGWLTYPANYDPRRRYPMVVVVHGGPSGMVPPTWGSEWSGQGYFQFSPNFRGSSGFGQAFARANYRDLGYGDLRDVLTGVKKLLETMPIDKNRIGITGWSYGGYLSMWAVTQTDIFHAAAPGAGISDWLSYGEANVPSWVNAYFGTTVYNDPAIYARSSPMNYIKNVRTPTLIIAGAGDGYCPPAQSLEYWYALKTLGVPTELVIYADEGHSMTKQSDRDDIARRTAAWFGQYLK